MNRASQVAKGAAALSLLLGLLGGVPYLLVTYVGWPLPHGVPTWSQFTTALGTRGIPDETLLKVLAVAVWIAWASLSTAVLTELIAIARGDTARRMPIAGLLQPLAAQLLAAVLVGVLALGRPLPSPRLAIPASSASLTTPVAAVLVADVTTTPPAANGHAIPHAPITTTYVVRADDTLWGIAAARLGDAERWKEIYELNHGRPQSDGRSLTNPHWIYRGWVLVLPTSANTPPSATPVPARNGAHRAPQPRTPPNAPTPASTAPAGPTGPATITNAPNAPHSSAHVGPRAPQREAVGRMPQRLPSGSLVAGSFVAGVLALLALGRRRRRHGYRYRPPEPARDLRQPPLGPILRALRQRGADMEEDDGQNEEPTNPVLAATRGEVGHDSGLEIGQRDGAAVRLDRRRMSPLCLEGEGALDVARYTLNALIVERGWDGTEIVAEPDVFAELLPGLDDHRVARRVVDAPAVVRTLEAELIARSRRLVDEDLVDIDAYRIAHPEDPVPTLVAVITSPDPSLTARLEELSKSGPKLDLLVLALSDVGFGAHLSVATDHRVSAAHGDRVAQLSGAELYSLDAEESAEIGDVLATAGVDEEADPKSSPAPEPDVTGEPWPEVTAVDALLPVEVRVLGNYRLFAHGVEITKGRRRAAKELLAWYALRPEGATAEAAVDAIWPETEPDKVSKRFWLALGDLRTLCRDPAGSTHVEVLVKQGERYAVESEAVSIDVWQFQAGLAAAVRAADPDGERQALRSAVDAYRGDFAEDEDYLWVEPAREDLHRRALDAHLRLAELEEELGAPERAVEVLEKAIALDRYAEEPYRRAMQLLARLERFDALDATWRSLQAALTDLGIESDRESIALYRSLTSSRPAVRAAG